MAFSSAVERDDTGDISGPGGVPPDYIALGPRTLAGDREPSSCLAVSVRDYTASFATYGIRTVIIRFIGGDSK